MTAVFMTNYLCHLLDPDPSAEENMEQSGARYKHQGGGAELDTSRNSIVAFSLGHSDHLSIPDSSFDSAS